MDNQRTASSLLARALSTLADSVEITDHQGRLVYVNDAFTTLTGYPREEALGRTPRALLRGDAHPPSFWKDLWSRVLAGEVWRGALQSRRRDGTPLLAEVTINPIVGEDGLASHFICVRSDPGRRAALTSEARRLGSLDGLQLVASGVSHEVNNPLAWISADLDLLGEQIEEAAKALGSDRATELQQLVAEAQHGVTRIRKVVSDLRTFGQPNHSERVTVDEVVTFALDMLSAEMDERCSLVQEIAPTPLVRGDRVALGQAVMHLLLNALHAVGAQGGTITVRTRTGRAGQAVLEVEDDGVGIADDHLDRIWEPFFSTRRAGEGAGLGLTHALRIAEKHGGSLEASSTPGVGTRLVLELPPFSSGSEARRPIVVIDDEPAILRILELALDGHVVTTFQSATDALEHLMHADVGVVICDLVMPVLTGPELFAQVIAKRPELEHRFLFVTGGGPHPLVDAFLDGCTYPVLRKPFRPGVLAGHVADLLQQTDTTT